MSSSIGLPKRHREVIKTLAGLDDEVYSRLTGQLRGLGTTVSSLTVTSALADERVGIGGAAAENLFSALVSAEAFRARSDKSTTEVARLVAEAEGLDLPGDKQARLMTRLQELLELPELSRIAKALDVRAEHEHVFHEARVLSDIRPIFSEHPEKSPTAAVVIHTLKLEYFGDDQRLHVFHLGMDDNDLTTLRDVLDRAREKGTTITDLLKQVSLPIITVEGD